VVIYKNGIWLVTSDPHGAIYMLTNIRKDNPEYIHALKISCLEMKLTERPQTLTKTTLCIFVRGHFRYNASVDLVMPTT
jgi:hypothetical protein